MSSPVPLPTRLPVDEPLDVVLDVELVSVLKGKERWELTVPEKIQRMSSWKERGNALFAKGGTYGAYHGLRSITKGGFRFVLDVASASALSSWRSRDVLAARCIFC